MFAVISSKRFLHGQTKMTSMLQVAYQMSLRQDRQVDSGHCSGTLFPRSGRLHHITGVVSLQRSFSERPTYVQGLTSAKKLAPSSNFHQRIVGFQGFREE